MEGDCAFVYTPDHALTLSLTHTHTHTHTPPTHQTHTTHSHTAHHKQPRHDIIRTAAYSTQHATAQPPQQHSIVEPGGHPAAPVSKHRALSTHTARDGPTPFRTGPSGLS